MQPYLSKVSNWARRWHFDFAVDKSASVIFTREPASHPPDFYIMNRIIPTAVSTKFLGLHFDRKLNWKIHIQAITDKILKKNNIFSVLVKRNFGPSTQSLITLFKTLIRSKADYGLIVYGAAAKSHLNKLDTALRIPMRLILGSFKCTPTEDLYVETGLEPTSLHREWLAARYTIQLGRKPLNAAYSAVHLTATGPSTLTPTHAPCLTNTTLRVRQINPKAFSLPPETRPILSFPAPWEPPLCKTIWFSDSKNQQQLTQSEQEEKSSHSSKICPLTR